jgi:hypothetical protein
MTDTLVVEQIMDTNAVNKGRFDRYKERIVVAPSPNFRIENYMLADLKQDSNFLDAFTLGILAAERAAVDQFISKHRNKTKEKAPVVIFQPALELKGTSKSERKQLRQTSTLENDCKKVARSCHFAPKVISSIHYDTTVFYPVYVRLIELERNLNKIVPLAYATRQADVLYNALGTPYINYVELTKIKSDMGAGNITYNVSFSALSVFLYPAVPFAVLSWLPQRYDAGMAFVLYDLQNKKYLYNTTRSFNISDKSEFYQTLYENYIASRKAIKQ